MDRASASGSVGSGFDSEIQSRRRAVDLGGPSFYQGGLKFEIKH